MILWEGTIYGEPVSKANSRRLVMFGKRPASIKSEKALDYAEAAARQIPSRIAPYEGPVTVSIDIWYASRRPDLDPSLILDALQSRIIKNDRQVFALDCRKFIDKACPRANVIVRAADELQVAARAARTVA